MIDTSIMDTYMSEKKAREYSRKVAMKNYHRRINDIEMIKARLAITIVFLLAILADTIMFQAGMF